MFASGFREGGRRGIDRRKIYIFGEFMKAPEKYLLAALLSLACIARASGQQAGLYNNSFLEFPQSAHIAALGGRSVSAISADAMFAFSNPALLSVDEDKLLHLNGSLYMKSSGYGSATYNMSFSDKDALSVGFLFAAYGKMQAYDASGNYLYDFSAQDFALTATYSRVLNRYFRIGASFKPVVSTYENYTSFSLGADIGVQYLDTVKLWSVGLAVTNFGGRVAKSQEANMGSGWLPINVTFGFSKRFSKAPFELSLTLQNLQKWDYNVATDLSGADAGKVNVGQMIARKIIIGVDVIPRSEKFWISLSYNFDRGLSLANHTVLSLAGLSGGVGFNLYMFKIGLAVACYSSAAVTGHFSVAVDINGFGKKKL